MNIALGTTAHPRFGIDINKRFQERGGYEKLAKLVTRYSITDKQGQGIEPGMDVAVNVTHLSYEPRTLEIYKKLIQQGYTVVLTAVPKDIDQLIQNSAIASLYNDRKNKYNYEYNHIFKLSEGGPEPEQLQELLGREAKPGEKVRLNFLINDSEETARQITREIIAQGGVPQVAAVDKRRDNILYENINPAHKQDQLHFNPQSLKDKVATLRKAIHIRCYPTQEFEDKIPTLSNQAEAYMKEEDDDEEYNKEILPVDSQRKADDLLNWSLFCTPTPGFAQRCGGQTEDEHGDFVYNATMLDKSIDEFKALENETIDYAKRMEDYEAYHVYSDDGETDFWVKTRAEDEPRPRPVIGSAAKHNVLPREIFTSAVEDSANGKIYFKTPFWYEAAKRLFEGVRLFFKDGVVTDVKVDAGDEEYLKSKIMGVPNKDLKVNGFDRIGEFAIGFRSDLIEMLKGKPCKDILYWEKTGFHLALGRAYLDTVINREKANKSVEHKDLIANVTPGSGFNIAAKEVGSEEYKLIYRDGEFTNAFLSGIKKD